MNKAEFVDAIAEAADLSKADAAKAVDAVLSTVIDTLKKGEQVAITGFGSFQVRRREARTGRNPRTKETIEIKAANVPSFKAGKGFKDALN